MEFVIRLENGGYNCFCSSDFPFSFLNLIRLLLLFIPNRILFYHDDDNDSLPPLFPFLTFKIIRFGGKSKRGRLISCFGNPRFVACRNS